MPNPSIFKASSATALPAAIEKIVAEVQTNHKVLVLVTGVFDVLHQEHIIFLEKAKAAGDVLLVGIESDIRVRAIKGPERPVNGENIRIENLLRLKIADGLFILPDSFGEVNDRRLLIHHLKPKYLAVSSHSDHLEAKRALMLEVGGEVKIVHDFNPAVSTTRILAESAKEAI